MSDTPRLFDEKTRRKLEQLMLVATKVRSGAIKGERRSVKRGTSIEFADYRDYVPGDDLRRLDWNIYARLERPMTKLFEDEEDLAVHLLLDRSGSMDWPREGDHNLHKFTFGQRIMAGLGFLALSTNDRLMMTASGGDNAQAFGPARGRAYGARLLKFVETLKPGGKTDLNAMMKQYAVRAGRPGLCIIISDLLSPDGYQEGLNILLGKGFEVAVIHLLAPDEIEPPLAGDLQLVDAETGLPQDVSIDADMRDLYTRRLHEWREGVRADLVKRGVHYLFVDTSTPWEKVILYDLRRAGLVK